MEQLIVGDILQGVVADVGAGGEGVIKLDGYPVFVPYAIDGEQVRVRVTYVKRDYAFATLLEVIEPSPYRRKPICPYFERCGGCDLMHICDAKQSAIKRDVLKNALLRIGGVDIDVPLPVQAKTLGYRNKLSLPFSRNPRSGRISLGFYEKRTHKVVPIKWCALNGQWAADVIEAVTGWANDNDVSVYDERTRKGLLRHTVARMLGSLSVTIVANGSKLPAADDLVRRLREKFDDPTVYISENTKNTNVIMGDSVRLLAGVERPRPLGKFSAEVSPLSFLQVNDDIRDMIYDAVADELKDFDGDIVELYSGVGLLTAQLALRLPASRIVSVEIEPSATKDAARLMQRLNICDRVHIVTDDAVNYMLKSRSTRSSQTKNSISERVDLAECDDAAVNAHDVVSACAANGEHDECTDGEKGARAQLSGCANENTLCAESDKSHVSCAKNSDTRIVFGRALVLDPPRRGCDRAVLEAADGFDRIIYVSCDPATLARDIKLLSPRFKLRYVRPFDMFPQTSSLETLAVLDRVP